MFSSEVLIQAEDVLNSLRSRGLRIVTAESCTGGLISGALTAVAGSSDVVDRGFVTYSNEAKSEMLGVREDLIDELGAVSVEVCEAMVLGALSRTGAAQVSVAVTGIAGPGGGTTDKPVGLVYVAAALQTDDVPHVVIEECRFGDIGRGEIREATVLAAFGAVGGLLEAS